MDKRAQANLNAIIKLASTVYDMYPHQTYALRHNRNNPGYKERSILIVKDASEQSFPLTAQYDASVGLMPASNGKNSMSNQPYIGQYNLLIDRPNIEGTGHGDPLSCRPVNPQDYN